MSDIKKGQDSIILRFESKIDKLEKNFTDAIDERMKVFRDEIVMDLSKEIARIDDLYTVVQSMHVRLDSSEHNYSQQPPYNRRRRVNCESNFDHNGRHGLPCKCLPALDI